MPENVAARVLNRPHRITATVEIPAGGAEGVLARHGGNVGGWSLFVQDGELHYVDNYVGAEEFRVVSNDRLPTAKAELRSEFEPTGPPDVRHGKGAPGRAQLYVDGSLVGQANFPTTIPWLISLGEGLNVGRDAGSPVSSRYQAPFSFTGKVHQVTVDISGELINDTEDEAEAGHKAVIARH